MAEYVKKVFKKEQIPITFQDRVFNGVNFEIAVTLFSPFHEKVYMLRKKIRAYARKRTHTRIN